MLRKQFAFQRANCYNGIIMILFQRKIEEKIRRFLFQNSMIVILDPRQSGKTTLAKKLIAEYQEDGAYYDCQLAEVRELALRSM